MRLTARLAEHALAGHRIGHDIGLRQTGIDAARIDRQHIGDRALAGARRHDQARRPA